MSSYSTGEDRQLSASALVLLPGSAEWYCGTLAISKFHSIVYMLPWPSIYCNPSPLGFYVNCFDNKLQSKQVWAVGCSSAALDWVHMGSTAPGNTGNILDLISLLEILEIWNFNWSSWKIAKCWWQSWNLCSPGSWLDVTVMSVGRSSSSHAQLEIVHTLLVIVILLIKL